MNWTFGFEPALAASAYALALVLAILIVIRSRSFVYIRNDSVGIVEKLWSFSGSVDDGFLTLDGRAGFRPACGRQ